LQEEVCNTQCKQITETRNEDEEKSQTKGKQAQENEDKNMQKQDEEGVKRRAKEKIEIWSTIYQLQSISNNHQYHSDEI
ncbi:11202_t:CDS:1, partial [Gigaspora rosea]